MHISFRKLPAILLTSTTLLLAVKVGAHHSFAVHFVGDEQVRVSGVVTDFRFANPHGVIEWTATDESGEEVAWQAETNSPNILKRRGWSRDSLRPGDEVTVTGFPARDESAYMRVSRVDFADGREPLVGQSAQNQD